MDAAEAALHLLLCSQTKDLLVIIPGIGIIVVVLTVSYLCFFVHFYDLLVLV